MKIAACSVAALLMTAAPLSAQTAAAPAPAPAAAAPAAPAAAAKFTLDTPIETIAADPKGKAVLDADLPGLTTHQMYNSFKSMSLNQLQPLSNGALTPEALAKAGTDLAAIK